MKIKNLFHQFDTVLFLLVLLLSLFGIIMINSATASFDSRLRFVLVQSLGLLLGIIAAFVLSLIPYEKMEKFKFPMALVGIALLTVVLFIGIGSEIGTRGWISIGSLSLQPAEIAKVCFIITFASHVSRLEDRINRPKELLKLCIHLAVPMGLVLLQPDFGSAMVFAVIFVVLLFVAGISYKYILGAFGSLLALLPIAWMLMKDYQKNRIRVFFDPESDPLGSGYHVIQSKIAIGSGQVFGKGYMQGTQTQLGYLPEKQTDFIYAVVGEEFGLIGCLLVLAVLIAIVVRIIMIARRANSSYGEFLCLGVAAMLLFHTVENIGMCIGLMPVTGIPLPFMSYGGSSILANYLAIGIVLSVRRTATRRAL